VDRAAGGIQQQASTRNGQQKQQERHTKIKPLRQSPHRKDARQVAHQIVRRWVCTPGAS